MLAHAAQKEMGEILADAALLLEHHGERRADDRGRGVEGEDFGEPPAQRLYPHQRRSSGIQSVRQCGGGGQERDVGGGAEILLQLAALAALDQGADAVARLDH